MNLGAFDHGYLLIGGLIVVGVALFLSALVLNRRLALSIRNEDRHQEKRQEYLRNTLTQLGVLLLGIGVSLFIFYFQQDFQERRRRHAETEVVLAKLASRLGRGRPTSGFFRNMTRSLTTAGLTSTRRMAAATAR